MAPTRVVPKIVRFCDRCFCDRCVPLVDGLRKNCQNVAHTRKILRAPSSEK